MSSYHNDQPITGTNEDPDRLNRESFAKHLTDILIIDPNDECLNISLEGEWGYGKTSVINLVKASATTHVKKPIIIEYNPWLAGKAEALIQDFLVQFSSQLNIPDRPKDGLKAAKELLAYSELFNVMKFIPGVEPWASTVQAVLSATGGTSKKIGKLKELDLLGRKNKIKETIKNLGQSIIVIIDDIDRLTPDEAFQVVRLVKAVADFPGTSFLLSFDPVYLAKAFEKHGIDKSDQYIDKVIQLRIALPLITHRDMQRLANIELQNLSDKSLTDHFEKDQERLSYIYHQHVKYLIRSPRELKRIFNHLRFVLAQTEGTVCFTDLYCLSVLAIKAQNIYQSLKDTPEYYVGRKFDESIAFDKRADVVEKNKDQRKQIFGSCNEKDRTHINGLLKEIFPFMDRDEYSIYGTDYDRCGRVASEKRLYTALHYQVPLGLASDTDIKSFIDGDIDRIKYLEKAIEDDFVERFFELLQQNIEKVDPSHTVEILKSVYDVFLDSDYLKVFKEAIHGFFSFDPFRDIVWLTLGLLESLEDKKSVLFELANEPKYLSITAEIVRRLMVQAGDISTDDPKLKENKWLPVHNDYKTIINEWSDVALKKLENGSFVNPIDASHIYFVLYRAAPDKVRQLFSKWLSEDSGVENIAKLIGHSGSDSSNGSFTKVSKEDFSELLNYSQLQALAEAELSSGKEITTFLRAVYLSITTGKKYYLKDAKEGW